MAKGDKKMVDYYKKRTIAKQFILDKLLEGVSKNEIVFKLELKHGFGLKMVEETMEQIKEMEKEEKETQKGNNPKK